MSEQLDLLTSVSNGHVLPPGWAWALVGELSSVEPRALTDGPFGSNLKSSHYTDEGPRVIRLQNIGDGQFHDAIAHISPEHFQFLQKHEARGGDVLVAMLGELLPRACLVPEWLGEAIVKADCVRYRVHPDHIDPRFIVNILNAPQTRSTTEDLVHGVGRPRLGLKLFRTLPLPLPPSREQAEIAETVDTHLTKIDSAIAGLKRVQANLKRYRASVLKAAVEGRLVPTEAELAREEGRDYEPASVLLGRILAERRRRWEQAELAKMKAKGKTPKNDKWKAKYKEPAPPDTEGLPELPEGWCWATVGQLGDVSGGLTKNAKRRALAQSVHYLRVANVYANELRLDDVAEIGVKPGELHRTLLQRADLLVVEGNGSADQIGRVAIWDGSIDPCVHQNHLIKVRFGDEETSVWTLVWLLSPGGRQAIVDVASSTSGLHTLSLSKVSGLPVPLPPANEQIRILDAWESDSSIVERSQEVVARSLARSQRLRQSILKWAFEGKLVDQDPNDEPASVLLDRIRAEREAATQKPKRAKKPRAIKKKTAKKAASKRSAKKATP